VLAGTNIPVGVEPEKVVPAALDMIKRRSEIAKKKGCGNLIGDGTAGEKISKILNEFKDNATIETCDTREDPYIIHVLTDTSENIEDLSVKGEIIAMYDDHGFPTIDINSARKIVIRVAKHYLLTK
jgi:hypothetical protein